MAAAMIRDFLAVFEIFQRIEVDNSPDKAKKQENKQKF